MKKISVSSELWEMARAGSRDLKGLLREPLLFVFSRVEDKPLEANNREALFHVISSCPSFPRKPKGSLGVSRGWALCRGQSGGGPRFLVLSMQNTEIHQYMLQSSQWLHKSDFFMSIKEKSSHGGFPPGSVVSWHFRVLGELSQVPSRASSCPGKYQQSRST